MISDRDREALAPIAEAMQPGKRLDIPALAGGVVSSFFRFYSLPENQAFLAGAFAGAAITAPRMRTIPSVIVSYACGLAAQKMYLMAEGIRADVRSIARAAGEELAGRPDGADVPAAG